MKWFLFHLILFSAFVLADTKIGSGANVPHIDIGLHAIQTIKVGNTTVWENSNPPTIHSFTANPDSIDLDTRPTGNIRFIWDIRNNPVSWSVYSGSSQISPDYVGNTPTATGFLLYAQPNQTTIYTLRSRSSSGSASQTVTVRVQQDLAITNFRRTGFHPTAGRGLYEFQFRIKGYPKPNNFVFSGAHAFTTDDRHLTAVSGSVNTWDFTIDFNLPTGQGALTVVATNGTTGQGSSATATLTNIDN